MAKPVPMRIIREGRGHMRGYPRGVMPFPGEPTYPLDIQRDVPVPECTSERPCNVPCPHCPWKKR